MARTMKSIAFGTRLSRENQ